MIRESRIGNLVWLDVESPDQTEVRELIEKRALPAHIAADILVPDPGSQLEVGAGYTFAVIHFPQLTSVSQGATRQEIDFILLPNTLITVRYGSVNAFYELHKEIEIQQAVSGDIHTSPASFFVYIVRKMYQFCRDELRAIESELKRAEDEIFIGHEREMVRKISELGRVILNFRQALTSHKYLVEDYARSLKINDNAPLAAAVKRWRREFLLTYERVQELRDIYHELRGTNDELLSTKQNEIIKTLTAISFITFPLSLIAGIFGMNTEHTPLIGHTQDFWFVIAFMIVCTLIPITYFTYKKWW